MQERGLLPISTLQKRPLRGMAVYVPLFPRATQAPHAEGGEEIVPHERGSDGEVKRGVKDE